VESQLFAKIVSMNCMNFEYSICNFSQKQMTQKDKNENRTKEGSGRVQVYRVANLIHSYTLECGFHLSNAYYPLPQPCNRKKRIE